MMITLWDLVKETGALAQLPGRHLKLLLWIYDGAAIFCCDMFVIVPVAVISGRWFL